MPRERRPWSTTTKHWPSAALCECVSRARFLYMAEIRILARDPSDRLLNVVARWRLGNPLKWAELVHVMTKGHR